MSDLGLGAAGTVTCDRCGAQNERRSTVCESCGAPLDAVHDAELERGDLEVEEVARGLSAEGYDAVFDHGEGGHVVCPSCGSSFAPARSDVVEARTARDTATNRALVHVLALRCPRCSTTGHVVVDPEEFEIGTSGAATASGGTEDGSPETRAETGKPGADAEHPLGDDRRHFETVPDGDTRSLRERGSLVDEDGEDIRQYTGEPVETEEGTVVPRQQNAGPGRIAGGGEWPDPNAPAAQPDP